MACFHAHAREGLPPLATHGRRYAATKDRAFEPRQAGRGDTLQHYLRLRSVINRAATSN